MPVPHSARASTALNAALRAKGLTVPDPEITLSTLGGGPHCLACPPVTRSVT